MQVENNASEKPERHDTQGRKKTCSYAPDFVDFLVAVFLSFYNFIIIVNVEIREESQGRQM